MRLSPLNIKKQEFPKSVKGYSIEPVNEFLSQVSDDVESLMNENETLRAKVEEQDAQLNEFKNIEKELRETLLRTQENSSKTLESTRKQAAVLVTEAEIKAQQILDNQKELEYKLRNDIHLLQREKNMLLARLKSLVYGYAAHLGLKVDEIKPRIEIKAEENADIHQSVEDDESN